VEQTEKKRFCAQSQVAVKVRGGTSSLTLTGSSDYTKQLADNRRAASNECRSSSLWTSQEVCNGCGIYILLGFSKSGLLRELLVFQED
jgi:hypothetical protein